MMGINIKLITSVCAVNLLAFATGNAYAWTSSVLLSLKSNDPDRNPLGRPITSFEESWISSLINLGAICGNILAGISSFKFGRKRTLLIFSFNMLISHSICYFASTPVELYLARFLIGIGVASVFTVIPIYVAEIAETETRGLLSCMMGVFNAFGLLFIYAVGPFVSLKLLSLLLMLPIFLFLFFFGIFVPESPYYLIASGQEADAEKSLNKLRNRDSCFSLKELADIKETVEASQNSEISFKEFVNSRSFRRGITITSTLMILQQFTGIVIILSYMENIFIASGSSLSSSTSTIIVGVIQIVVVGLSSYLSDRWGRRFLIAISSGGTVLPLLSLSLYFFLKNTGSDVSLLWWLPIISLIIFIITYNIGLGPLPWVLVGELFSTNTKFLASTITATLNVTVGFIITIAFPNIEKFMGYQEVFCFFAASAFLCLLFVLWCVPETKGKRFQEILTILEN